MPLICEVQYEIKERIMHYTALGYKFEHTENGVEVSDPKDNDGFNLKCSTIDETIKVIMFECPKCSHNTDWIKDVQTISENKRGIPCPNCNE